MIKRLWVQTSEPDTRWMLIVDCVHLTQPSCDPWMTCYAKSMGSGGKKISFQFLKLIIKTLIILSAISCNHVNQAIGLYVMTFCLEPLQYFLKCSSNFTLKSSLILSEFFFNLILKDVSSSTGFRCNLN